MSNYRNVSLSFWTDSKVDDDFTPEDKYFYLYLMTNPHTSICGCYEISMKQMERETGYNTDTVKRLLQRMEEMHGVIKYCSETKEVLLLNWWKYNWSNSPKVKSAIVSVVGHIKNKSFRKYVMDMISLRYEYGMDTTDTDTVSDTVSETDTETEYRDREREAHAPQQSKVVFQQIDGHPMILLTESEFKMLRRLDYSKTGKSLEAYLAILDERLAEGKVYKSHYLTIRKWAMQDGATISHSSIDIDEVEKLMNAFHT